MDFGLSEKPTARAAWLTDKPKLTRKPPSGMEVGAPGFQGLLSAENPVLLFLILLRVKELTFLSRLPEASLRTIDLERDA